MEHVPAPAIVINEPETVHTFVVVEAKFTGSPEVAVAVIVKGITPKV
jgi:hypothetical protein